MEMNSRGTGEAERVRGVQFTANLGQEWTGIRTTAQERDFQVSKKGLTGQADKRKKEGGASEKGITKGDVSMHFNVYTVLIKDCV
jgi:hypothetical protein